LTLFFPDVSMQQAKPAEQKTYEPVKQVVRDLMSPRATVPPSYVSSSASIPEQPPEQKQQEKPQPEPVPEPEEIKTVSKDNDLLQATNSTPAWQKAEMANPRPILKKRTQQKPTTPSPVAQIQRAETVQLSNRDEVRRCVIICNRLRGSKYEGIGNLFFVAEELATGTRKSLTEFVDTSQFFDQMSRYVMPSTQRSDTNTNTNTNTAVSADSDVRNSRLHVVGADEKEEEDGKDDAETESLTSERRGSVDARMMAPPPPPDDAEPAEPAAPFVHARPFVPLSYQRLTLSGMHNRTMGAVRDDARREHEAARELFDAWWQRELANTASSPDAIQASFDIALLRSVGFKPSMVSAVETVIFCIHEMKNEHVNQLTLFQLSQPPFRVMFVNWMKAWFNIESQLAGNWMPTRNTNWCVQKLLRSCSRWFQCYKPQI
jgi:hypothetical protein